MYTSLRTLPALQQSSISILADRVPIGFHAHGAICGLRELAFVGGGLPNLSGYVSIRVIICSFLSFLVVLCCVVLRYVVSVFPSFVDADSLYGCLLSQDNSTYVTDDVDAIVFMRNTSVTVTRRLQLSEPVNRCLCVFYVRQRKFVFRRADYPFPVCIHSLTVAHAHSDIC
jgi:hypothetical protein